MRWKCHALAILGAVVLGFACGGSKDGYIILNVDADTTVDKAAVSQLQVTVGSITRDYSVSKALPGSVGIVTSHSGSLDVTVVGIGSQKALGKWSGTIVAKVGQTVTQDVLLACVGGDCGTIVGGDAGVDSDSAGQDSDAGSTNDVGQDRTGTEDDARDGGPDGPTPSDAAKLEHSADSADASTADGQSDSVDAQPSGLFLGTGRDNALTVVAGSTAQVNVYAALALDAVPGATSLTVDTTTGFSVGQLVMIWQTTVATSQRTSGDQTTINLATANVGQYELVRIGTVTASTNTIALATPISSTAGYHAVGTQVVGVPEYTDVTIPGTSNIVPAMPWNGSKGGVVAFLATGTVTNAGTIQADAAGFRGGTKVLTTNAVDTGCSGLDGMPTGGYAMKGETFVTSAFSMMSGGRGNLATAGGGGDCHNSGGAGGGHVGLGGGGGFSWTGDGSRAVGGMGGASLTYDPLAHLSFGGGGGAGESNNIGQTDGGNGGGLVFVVAGSLTGLGTISANGAAGTTSSADGAGGGGAGGAVIVRLTGAATCGSIQASGGAGGDMDPTTDTVGPGGGGGTGKVFLNASSGTCPATSKPGRAGLLNGTTAYGAGAGQ